MSKTCGDRRFHSLGSHKYKFIETKESVNARKCSRKFVESMAILKNRDEIGEVQNQNGLFCLFQTNKEHCQ